MWSYYGAKTNIVHLYPKPKHDRIIEPFAGTARYALRYFEKDVLLVDKYKVITDIWSWLQKCSPKDILTLPRFKAWDNINHHKYDCEAQRFLVGFLVGFGFTDPRKTATPRMRNRPNAMNYTIKKIASQLYKIKHWKVINGTYEDIKNQKATWFIDPPYQFGGHAYKCSNKKICFEMLSKWSMDRHGQVIVCENTKATWMDFKPMAIQNTLTGINFEAIWTNEKTHYDNIQQKLF
ncbi:MAG: hypothetical protein ACHQ1D_00040 [Nitrososphaerales archaeon]